MAGRIRTIKPELLEDAKAARLGHAAWRLFVSGLLLADDFGVLRAEPDLLAGAIFWGRPNIVAEDLIDELCSSGLWITYERDGQCYAYIRNWGKHQKVDKPNENRRLPAPLDGLDALSAVPRESVAICREGDATDHDHDQYPDPDRDDELRARTRVISPSSSDPIGPAAHRLAIRQAELRNAIIADGIDPNARKFELTGMGKEQPILEALRLQPESELNHVLEVQAAEARGLRTVKYLDGVRNWKAEQVLRASAKTPQEALSEAESRRRQQAGEPEPKEEKAHQKAARESAERAAREHEDAFGKGP